MINKSNVLNMSIFPEFIRKIIPTYWIVKEFKFKRTHKMGYLTYFKTKYLNIVDKLENNLYPNESYDIADPIQKPIFLSMFLCILLTGVVFIPTFIIIFILKYFITINIGSLLFYIIFGIGIIPFIWYALKTILYWILIPINYIFNITYDEK